MHQLVPSWPYYKRKGTYAMRMLGTNVVWEMVTMFTASAIHQLVAMMGNLGLVSPAGDQT